MTRRTIEVSIEEMRSLEFNENHMNVDIESVNNVIYSIEEIEHMAYCQDTGTFFLWCVTND